MFEAAVATLCFVFTEFCFEAAENFQCSKNLFLQQKLCIAEIFNAAEICIAEIFNAEICIAEILNAAEICIAEIFNAVEICAGRNLYCRNFFVC